MLVTLGVGVGVGVTLGVDTLGVGLTVVGVGFTDAVERADDVYGRGDGRTVAGADRTVTRDGLTDGFADRETACLILLSGSRAGSERRAVGWVL